MQRSENHLDIGSLYVLACARLWLREFPLVDDSMGFDGFWGAHGEMFLLLGEVTDVIFATRVMLVSVRSGSLCSISSRSFIDGFRNIEDL